MSYVRTGACSLSCLMPKVARLCILENDVVTFSECLVHNKCSSSIVENYVSAIKASFVLYELPYAEFEHPR